MKVLLVANSAWNLWHYRLPLIRALDEAGHDISLVCPSNPYTPLLRDLGYPVHDWPVSRRGLGPMDNLKASKELQRLYELERPDIVHHFTIKANLLGGLAAHRAGVPRIINAWTGLGYAFSDALLPRLLRPGLRWLLQASHRAATTVCQTVADAKMLGHHGATDVLVVPGTGVDLKRFHPVAKHNPRPLVLMASRLLKNKGVFSFAEAAKALHGKADFILAGEPDPGNPDSISETTYEWLQTQVQYVGQVDDMTDLFSFADIAVLPTTYNEGIPLFLQEAAACGLPIVASDLPGCRAVVRHGSNGFLVPRLDPLALHLTEEIQTLIRNPWLREQYGQSSRALAEELFDEKTINRRYLDLYNFLGAAKESASV